ncbi:hypothetical protein pdam_00017651, partial [Pocillopora damicornis]
ETILHSVGCARRKVLEPEKDVEGVIYVGTRLSERNHSYYPTFKKQYRYTYQKKLLKEELPTMKALEEEERPISEE